LIINFYLKNKNIHYIIYIHKSGAFSEVKIAINRQTKEKFAVKIIDKSKCKGKENMIDTEISILSKVHHENIVRLYDLYQIDNKIYLVMEL